MNDDVSHPGLRPGEEDLRFYTQNLNEMDFAEEQRQRGGQVVARSFDGKTAYAYAETWEELVQRLHHLGIDPSNVVFGYVFGLDESII